MRSGCSDGEEKREDAAPHFVEAWKRLTTAPYYIHVNGSDFELNLTVLLLGISEVHDPRNYSIFK